MEGNLDVLKKGVKTEKELRRRRKEGGEGIREKLRW